VTEPAAQPGQVRYGHSSGRWVLFATVLGSGMTFVDATVVNIALPRLGSDLHAGAAALQWTVNGYTLSLASLILLGGSLGDRFGRRRVFMTGVVWFAAASLLCGLAPTIGVLIAARIVQGVGGALMTPGSLAIIESSFHPDDRPRAIGAWSGLGGIAGALGPFLGGWLVQAASWRWVFLINAPLALLVIVAAARHIPETRDPRAVRGFDVTGVVTAATALAGLTYGFTAWPDKGGGSPQVLASLGVAVLALVAFVETERRSAHPMLPLEIFRHRAFTAANLVTFAVYAAIGAVFFLVVLNLQVVAGYSPTAAGTAMLPVTVLMLLLSARSGALAGRIGPRIPMAIGPAVCSVALIMLSRVGAHAFYPTDVLPAVIIFGLGLSLTVAPLTATALGALDEHHAGIASGVNNAVARAAGLLAVAVLPLAAGLGSGSLTAAASLGPAYKNAMMICAVLLLAGSVIALVSIPSRLPRQAAAAEPAGEPEAVRETPVLRHCAIAGTPLHPRSPGEAAPPPYAKT